MTSESRSAEEETSRRVTMLDYGPLPDFVASWGHSVQRPLKLPEDYDIRTDPAYIFVFPENPLTQSKEWYYVVPKGCKSCKHQRQRCDRGSPCKRCNAAGRRCDRVSDEWDELPATKINKGTNVTSSHAPQHQRQSLSGPLPSRSIGGRNLRQQKAQLSYAEDFGQSPPRLPPRTSAKKRRSLDSVSVPVKRPRNQGRAIGASSTQARRASAPLPKTTRDRSVLANDDGFPPWKVVTPNFAASAPAAPPHDQRTTAVGNPWAWSSRKSELLNVIPELSQAVNGFLWMFSETPVLILEGQKWPEDYWDGGTTFTFSMVREYVSNHTETPLMDPSGILLGTDQDVNRDMETGANITELVGKHNLFVHPGSTNDLSLLRSNSLNYSNPLLSPEDTLQEDCPPPPSSCTYPHRLSEYPGPSSTFSEPPPFFSIPMPTQYPTSAPLRGLTGAFSSDLIRPRLDSYHVLLPPFLGFRVEDSISDKNSFGSSPGYELHFGTMLHWPTPTEARGMQSLPTTRTADDIAQPPSLAPVNETSSGSTPPVKCPSPQTVLNADVEGIVIDPVLLVEDETNGYSPCQSSEPSPIKSPLPSEIQALIDYHEAGVPVNVVIHEKSAFLPFLLPNGCEYAFLGFFNINSIQTTYGEARIHSDKLSSTRVQWKFSFEWTSDGELQPRCPWWVSSCANQNEVVDNLESLFPIPSYVVRSDPNADSNAPYTTVEQYSRKGWHCLSCGKINTQSSFCFQRCSSCTAQNNAPPVDALYVRNPYNMSPTHAPGDRYPPWVSCSTERAKNGMRVFMYQTSPGASVTHYFTGNQPELQHQSTSLFHEVQWKVELAWQSVNTSLASGPYFTYLASSAPDSPEPISELKGLVQALYSEFPSIDTAVLDDLTLLAWHGSGKRKSPSPLTTRRQPIAMLCLGADVELIFGPRSAHTMLAGGPAADFPAPSRTLCRTPAHAVDDEDEEMGEDDPGVGVFVAAQSVPISRTSHKSSMKEGKGGDDILITLFHGDMVLLFGDDFEWSLRRTGMGILAIGSFGMQNKT